MAGDIRLAELGRQSYLLLCLIKPFPQFNLLRIIFITGHQQHTLI